MYLRPKIIFTCLILGLALLAHGQSFDKAQVYAELEAIILEAQEPGVYKGPIAIAFSNRYNELADKFPESADQLEVISDAIAQKYGLSLKRNDQYIESASFNATMSDKERWAAKEDSLSALIEAAPKAPSGPDPMKVLKEVARFPGCEHLEEYEERLNCGQKKFLEYIYSNIRYPEVAKSKNVQGKVFVKFHVEPDGSIAGAIVERGLGYGCDEESLRVINAMNNLPDPWTPAINNADEQVRFTMVVPISFRLQ